MFFKSFISSFMYFLSKDLQSLRPSHAESQCNEVSQAAERRGASLVYTTSPPRSTPHPRRTPRPPTAQNEASFLLFHIFVEWENNSLRSDPPSLESIALNNISTEKFPKQTVASGFVARS